MQTKHWFVPGIFFLTAIGAFGPNLSAAEAALLVGNTEGNNIVQFDEFTGEFLGEFIGSDSGLISPDSLIFGTDGNLYISSGKTSETSAIFRFDGRTGKFIDQFASGGGMYRPYGIAFGPDNNLYVSSFLSDQILRYDSITGQFLDVFAQGMGTADGLNGPNGLLFGPDGSLYVTTQGSVAVNGTPNYLFESQVLRYNIATGAGEVFVDQPVPSPSSGFVSLLGLAIGPADGNLYVSDFANDIRRYNLQTGELLGSLSTNYTGTIPSNNFMGSLAFGPDGNLFTVGFDRTQGNIGSILRYNGATGAPLPTPGNAGALFVSNSVQLKRPIGLLFSAKQVPEPAMTVGLLAVSLGAIAARRKGENN
jgi:sugar lactone lactonase YvrE